MDGCPTRLKLFDKPKFKCDENRSRACAETSNTSLRGKSSADVNSIPNTNISGTTEHFMPPIDSDGVVASVGGHGFGLSRQSGRALLNACASLPPQGNLKLPRLGEIELAGGPAVAGVRRSPGRPRTRRVPTNLRYHDERCPRRWGWDTGEAGARDGSRFIAKLLFSRAVSDDPACRDGRRRPPSQDVTVSVPARTRNPTQEHVHNGESKYTAGAAYAYAAWQEQPTYAMEQQQHAPRQTTPGASGLASGPGYAGLGAQEHGPALAPHERPHAAY
jgi:hypothetical protein